MPTDDDRASASIRFEGEARRLAIRRPRLDRDGLFLFGRRYAAQTVTLTVDEVDQLRHGRTIAVDVVGEYLIYLRLQDGVDRRSEGAARSSAVHAWNGCTGGGIPQRERPDRVPSDFVRAVAARVRVNADRRAGVHTPQWIIDLANSEQISYGRGGASMPSNPARGFRRLWRNWRANMEQPRGHPRRSQGGSQ